MASFQKLKALFLRAMQALDWNSGFRVVGSCRDYPRFCSCAMECVCQAAPRVGERVLVIQWRFLKKILAVKKVMEIRRYQAKTGTCLLGYKGKVYARCNISDSGPLGEMDFHSCFDQHQVQRRSQIKYTTMSYMLLSDLYVYPEPFTYFRLKGAIGWNIFRLSAADMPPRKRKTVPGGKSKARPAKRKVRTPVSSGESSPSTTSSISASSSSSKQ